MAMLQEVIQKAFGCFQKVSPGDKFGLDFRQGRDSGDGASQNSRTSMAQMPSTEQLDSAFQDFVAELDLSPDNQKVLYDQPTEKKWLMLCEQNYRQDRFPVCQPPDYYLGHLRNLQSDYSRSNQVLQHLEGLRITLRTQPHSYVQRFIDLGGKDLLVDVIDFCTKQPTLSSLASALLACVKALLNSTYGRRSVLRCDKTLKVIAIATGIEHARCKVLALEILSGLCLVPDGHNKVLIAISEASHKLGERTRFQRLLFDLWKPYSTDKDTLRVKTAIMSFINALLKSESAECCLKFRIHLRHEFLMLGIKEIIDHLRNLQSPTLIDHLDLFEMMQQEDEQELISLLDSEATIIDFSSPSNMIELLTHRLEDSIALPHLQSLIQHMLLISGDQKNIQLWQLFDLIIQQLSMQATMGFVADAYEPIPSIDIDDIIARLHTQSEYEALQKSHDHIQIELEKTKKALYVERRKVAELEVRLHEKGETSSEGRVSPISSGQSTPPADPITVNVICENESHSVPLPPICPPVIPPPPPPSIATLKGSVFPCSETIKSIPKPCTSLKCINWQKLNSEQLKGTIWEGMEDEKMYQKLDVTEMDRNFCLNANGKIDIDSMDDTSATLRRRLTRDTAISVIEQRRAQNCTILLSRLRLRNEEIKRLILTMDKENQLPKDMIEQLLKFIPTHDEIGLINGVLINSKPSALATADNFLLEMSSIPRYEQRLECLHFVKSFKEMVTESLPRIQVVEKASNAVSNSKRLKKMLSLILAIGNYLNYGKRNGNAQGISLPGINIFAEIKNSVRNDRNLLHYLADLVDQKFPDLLRLKRELLTIFEASRVSRKELQKEIRSLESGLQQIRKELEIHQSDRQRNTLSGDQFISVMNEFLDHSYQEYAKVDKTHRDMKIAFHSCIRLFAFDSTNCSPDEFFGILAKFLTSFTDAIHKIWKEREESEAIKRRTLARTLFAKKSTTPKTAFYTEKRSNGRDFEQLISALQSGELFSEELSRLRTSFRSPKRPKRQPSKKENYTEKSPVTKQNSRER